MVIEELKDLLSTFLDRWTLDKIKNMSIEEYVGVGNKDTFTQWVETKTRRLGSIKGLPGSIKFGIYERKNTLKRPKNYKSDHKYSWLKGYGDTAITAFDNIRNDIIRIIELAYVGKFHEINDIQLSDMFKWKIAFLYSNERLIPIYKREILFKIANHFGFATTQKTGISEIQNLMINNKPIDFNVYEYMWELYRQFGLDIDLKKSNNNSSEKSRKGRKGTRTRKTDPQKRRSGDSYIAEQKHNEIQEILYFKLIKEYGEENVILEENHVDVKLFQPKYISFYEVKSSSFASECIKQALGQLLFYSLNDEDKRIKKHIVVGQYPPTENDNKFIYFIKQNFKLDIDYLYVEIE